MKRYSIVLLGLFGASLMRAEDFELLNKLEVPIEIAIGSGAQPLAGSYQAQKLALTMVNPGGSYKTVVDNKTLPQLLIRQKDKPDAALIYEFQAKSGKKIYVRLVDSKAGIVLEPQSFVLNSLGKNDIKLLKTVGVMRRMESPKPAPQPGAPKSGCPIGDKPQTAVEILGFPKGSQPSKKDITKAYREESKLCHPDKDKTPGATVRMQRLNEAYERLK